LEVNDPAMSVLVEGQGGPKSYTLNKIKDTNNTSLVLFGQRNYIRFLNKANIKNFNSRKFHTRVKAASRIGPHSSEVVSVIVGSLLGDCYGNRRSVEGTRLCYRQSVIHKDYLFWLYKFFYERGYCSNLEPRMYTRKLKKGDLVTEYYGYEFNTFTFRSFNWIYEMFYKKGKKVLSPSIEQFITPLALAVWIMSSGKYIKGIVELTTNLSTKQDIERLIKILNNCFGLTCEISQCKKGFYVVVISRESVKLLQTIVLPYIHPTMKHKIGVTTEIPPIIHTYNSKNKGLPQPVAIYSDIEAQKSTIYHDNRNKAGIYRLTNKITGSSYIGSSVNLSRRFTNYFSILFLTREVARMNSIIYRALLKYGFLNFKLEILEYCKPADRLAREQYYLDLCSPKYNILTKAGSSQGFKHSPETLVKFKKRIISPSTLEKMRTHLAKHNIELNKNKRFKVDIYDLVTNKNNTFSSVKEAASSINSHSKTLSERYNLDLKKGVCVPYRGRYVITIYKNGSTSPDHFQKVELARLNSGQGYEVWKVVKL
jgi:hypothetical protein